MDEAFEKKSLSRTTKAIYNISHRSIRLMKWMAYHERIQEKIFFSI